MLLVGDGKDRESGLGSAAADKADAQRRFWRLPVPYQPARVSGIAGERPGRIGGPSGWLSAGSAPGHGASRRHHGNAAWHASGDTSRDASGFYAGTRRADVAAFWHGRFRH